MNARPTVTEGIYALLTCCYLINKERALPFTVSVMNMVFSRPVQRQENREAGQNVGI